MGQDNADLKLKIADARLNSRDNSVAYAMAVLSYASWMTQNLNPDPVIFAKAMIDSKNGTPLISNDVARNLIVSVMSRHQAEQAELDKVNYKDHIAMNETFLAKNKARPGVIVTPSGLQYEVVKMGTGPKPTLESTVKVHYTGKLIDSTEFDSSVKRNAPAQFPVSGVIAGWTEALQLMPVGSKFILYIPENLAYGARGAGNTIKPFSTLIFEVELLEIVK
ncbi:MAG: FKBP-type peptidyl-prolyl cis-trans isomerase [Bacteroidales bacterium]